MTDCTPRQLELQGIGGGRRLVAAFDGGRISTEGGLPLLAAVERRTGLLARFAACFVDQRDPAYVEHPAERLVAQRVLGLVLGYEDLVDHDELRSDPLLAAVVGAGDPLGRDRRQERDQGKPLAGKSTLHRLEWGALETAEEDRYRRIAVDPEAVDRFFVDLFLDSYASPPEEIVLDLDATDVPLHGTQEGRFFHGYYGCYCYLPLYIFCGDHLLCARLRPSGIGASEGSVEELERIVEQIRAAWPEVPIVVRADSGFACEELMAWCETSEVDFVLGLARNARLELGLEPAFEKTEQLCAESGLPERVYDTWLHSTLQSWSRHRRVIGKAEITTHGPNPRFLVTSLPGDPATIYERIYCARGEMENRIKEQQMCLFAGRASAHLMRVNQVRLWFSSVAYLLLAALRRLALAGSQMARARCDTIRLRLLKIGARVQVSVRRVRVALASACPYQAVFWHAWDRLQVC
jgi:hypothetical protein